jgi:hypothetical protein
MSVLADAVAILGDPLDTKIKMYKKCDGMTSTTLQVCILQIIQVSSAQVQKLRVEFRIVYQLRSSRR